MTKLNRRPRYKRNIIDNDDNHDDLIDLSGIDISIQKNESRHKMRPPNTSDRYNYSYKDDIDVDPSTTNITTFLGDSGESDSANLLGYNQNLPDDPEGDLERRLGIDMGMKHGIQNFTESTLYPESEKTITKRVTFQE
jgi:hypothetical protein